MTMIGACLILAGLGWASFPALMPAYFEWREPLFLNPVGANDAPIHIRNDVMGLGHFGASRSNGGRLHKGLDIAGRIGEKVVASKSGRVTFADKKGGYGNLLVLTHPDGTLTRYAHLKGFQLSLGDWVPQGKTIGFVGKTGNARSARIQPHVHFEIRRDGKAIDPTTHLAHSLIIHRPFQSKHHQLAKHKSS